MTAGNLLNSIQTNVGTAQSYQSPLKTAYESEAMKIVRDGVNSLVDSLPGLIKALDEVAKLHPFIGSKYSGSPLILSILSILHSCRQRIPCCRRARRKAS